MLVLCTSEGENSPWDPPAQSQLTRLKDFMLQSLNPETKNLIDYQNWFKVKPFNILYTAIVEVDYFINYYNWFSNYNLFNFV